ncbi:hypothetical protein CEUSTIGMA_g8495.t1 [Chlamydomonas eustigma]|uniref:GrpE protein homolog n=1 Tax=Chlamydomonas eustigma TaxID=1157962 RepID=A0A250XE68_9CHLO|nr:hypothetical protein CEUSTIGMA_g8495.t1 [Chlamydomonas eustigma]|eukprot:GAX81060.1 hypothetical protein CEUSTIGMA_g8495.t1 [Chlamydomonas eustigma]
MYVLQYGRASSVIKTSKPNVCVSAVRPARLSCSSRLSSIRRTIVCVAEGAAQQDITEEASANEAADNLSSQDSAVESPIAEDQSDLSPMDRAWLALEAENLNRSALESAMSELAAEMARLQDSAAAAETRALTLEATMATAKDQLLRLNADFDNFRRRTRDEKDQLAVSVRGDVVTSLLPVVDNFELARTQVKAESEAEQKINNSYQSLYKQFVDFLRGLGVEAVPTVGTPFDPNLHEAIMKEPNAEVEDGTVLMEFRKGFKIGDKLLRPAMVKVSVNEEGPVVTASSSEE